MNPQPDRQTVDLILTQIQSRFYHDNQKLFFRDRRFLLYVITWPASWFHERGLRPPASRYKQLVLDRLDDIQTHGDPDQYLPFFPRYLLKCLQDYLAWHGDSLYQELKHIRNALYNLDSILEQLQPANAQPAGSAPDDSLIEILAHTHSILAGHYPRKSTKTASQQLSLF